VKVGTRELPELMSIGTGRLSVGAPRTDPRTRRQGNVKL
jgi:hypothetical protein